MRRCGGTNGALGPAPNFFAVSDQTLRHSHGSERGGLDARNAETVRARGCPSRGRQRAPQVAEGHSRPCQKRERLNRAGVLGRHHRDEGVQHHGRLLGARLPDQTTAKGTTGARPEIDTRQKFRRRGSGPQRRFGLSEPLLVGPDDADAHDRADAGRRCAGLASKGACPLEFVQRAVAMTAVALDPGQLLGAGRRNRRFPARLENPRRPRQQARGRRVSTARRQPRAPFRRVTQDASDSAASVSRNRRIYHIGGRRLVDDHQARDVVG
jgi:hypothetical protein